MAREWIAQWEENYRRKLQRDAEADQRAFLRGHGDLEPGPIDQYPQRQSSTNRTANV